MIYIFRVAHSIRKFSTYLPVNREAERWEIWCNDAGYARIPPGSPYPPNPGDHPRSHSNNVATGRVLNEFQVVYLTAGKGWFRSEETGHRELAGGDTFLLFPGVRHSYSPYPATGWHEYWVGFSGEHAHRLWSHGLFSPDRAISSVGLSQELIADYERIVGLCRDQPPGFQVRLGALVLQLLAHIHTSEMSARTSKGDSLIIDRARAVMQDQIDEGVEVETIARRVGVGYARLLDVFRQYTGLTPYQYFLQLRIRRAQELLREPGASVKAVSATMNFENQYYFSRLFKKKTGVAPTSWIASIRAGDSG